MVLGRWNWYGYGASGLRKGRGMELFEVVSPRQTSIYVMCPWDHDI